jgi:hypothetical protein
MKFIASIITILSFQFILSQSTFQGSITLTNQQEIEDFGNLNYESITGYLRIEANSPSDVTSLSSLSSLNSIGGSLDVINCDINSFDGLNNISQIGGLLQIYNNDNLTSIEALENLETIFSLSIVNNELLANLNGLNNLTNSNGLIEFLNNPSLESISGLEGLDSIQGTLFIQSNHSLLSLNGLQNITEVNGNLVISACSSLNDINGLSNIELVTGNLYVTSNTNLNDFCGIYNLINSNGLLGDYIITGNIQNPTMNELVDDCSILNGNIDFLYPESSTFFSSSNIKVKIQSSTGLNLPQTVNVYYKTNTTNWIYDDNYALSDSGDNIYFLDWSKVSFDEPRAIKLRIDAVVNGEIYNAESDSFFIQPLNYYSEEGFFNDGLSTLNFPLQGLTNVTDGWFPLDTSTAHNCLDGNAQDWFYTLLASEGFGCNKDLRSSFVGKVIYIEPNYQYDNCGNNSDQKYGRNIVIQSLDDRTFAIRYAHLSSVRSDIVLGSIVTENQVIGKVGGTGTMVTHLHVALYKNIYDYVEIDFSGSPNGIITKNIFELLNTGNSVTNEDVPECNFLESKFSAAFDYNYYFNISNGAQIVLDNSQLSSLIQNQFNSIVGDLIIGSNSNNPPTEQSSDITEPITSLDGLESLFSIDGNLIISNTELLDLNGLENLTHVSGDVIIKDNVLLSNFCGLFKLIENEGITGSFVVNDNLINPTQEDILSNLACDSTLDTGSIQTNSPVYIYPNPTNRFIQINKSILNSVESISIYNISGKLVHFSNDKRDSIDLSKYNVGMYFIRIKTNNSIHFQKIIRN